MSLHRTYRKRLDRQEANETRLRNRTFKDKERSRREARMLATVKGGALPYHPAVMSWLSRKLEKPAGRITQTDVRALLK